MINDDDLKADRQQDLDELTYIISHDLQEPLRMITSYVQLLNKRYGDKLDDNARDYIRYAVDGSNRLKQMMDDLLTYSRIGKPALVREEVDPVQVIEKVKTLLRSKYPDSKDTIEFTARRQISISADKALLTKLLYNLIDNSLKFNHSERPEIRVLMDEDDMNWKISVSDNGVGIDKDYHGKIFGIFQKLHNHADYPGSGIGLAICEKIVDRHKGTISIDSEPEKGSTFHVTIKKER
ncbi:MAG TPA: ATP-binding protein [Ignavibacteria bacterium]|nr:ATP-binding protein [Ignavibacteria bacterium]HMR00699.1 ATP-binding protein [Ignavibacteria bacterium]